MSKFTIPHNWKILYGAFSLLLLALAVHDIFDFRAWGWFDSLVALAELLLALMFFTLLFVYLLVDKDGFEYNSGGVTYRGEWSDVGNICKQKHLLLDYEGFYISKDKVTVCKGFSWFLSKENFIPLSLFSNNWRDSELGKQIDQYLPQIQNG